MINSQAFFDHLRNSGILEARDQGLQGHQDQIKLRVFTSVLDAFDAISNCCSISSCRQRYVFKSDAKADVRQIHRQLPGLIYASFVPCP